MGIKPTRPSCWCSDDITWQRTSDWISGKLDTVNTQHYKESTCEFISSSERFFCKFPPGKIRFFQQWNVGDSTYNFGICSKKFISQQKRKWMSVSRLPVVQWTHSLSSLDNQLFLCFPFSKTRLWALSLYLLIICLCFVPLTVRRYSAKAYSLFKAW